VSKLGERELAWRASRVRLVLTDVDGVLTDGGVYYGEQGELMKRFSVRDGMGVERLRASGIATGLVTRERSAAVARRAEKLHIDHAYLGVFDKRLHLSRILDDAAVTRDEVAYIGDDVNDLEILTEIGAGGLTAAPADAFPTVAAAVHRVTRAAGGHGAFREFAEWILELREQAARALSGPSQPAARA